MTNRPTPQPGVLKIDKYIPGRSKAASGITTVKLSSNESPLGASPKVMAAYGEMADQLSIYPEGSSALLREALGQVHGLDADRIVIGVGSGELLQMLAQVYLGDGDEAVMNEYGFLLYPIVTKAAGATPVTAKASDYCADVDAILAAVTPRTKIVFLDNPNNPTGTYLSEAELVRLHKGLRGDILLVIDGAYAEYVTAGDYVSGSALATAHANVVMVRTFSKIGLAAARVGWLYGPEHVVDALNRIRGPFNINVGAQAAGVAAVRDEEFTTELVAHNAQWREWLSVELASNQIRVLPSQTNFILVLFPETSGLTAGAANEALLAKGLVVREMSEYGMPNGLRISIGSGDAMRAVAAVLKEAAKGSGHV